jgi:hypothetical protein
VNEVPFAGTSRAQGSSSQRGQQSPSSVTGFEQVTGGHSICQQSISPYCNRLREFEKRESDAILKFSDS